ncbi:MAG TPA: prepilin-type N-terminal cleavage/methylation domain-containing protein [Gemmatimonadaceae bacterium]|jgi:Tfp pilus assembly protein FimT|nr:prepilin-type N-terminal cleavage/methylation domain-containing protein [Gemmatimonadaceae bacterium]
MPKAGSTGYTLIEIIIALLLFTIGGLALVSTSALIARATSTDGIRERAGRIAASRLEILSIECQRAVSGRETLQQVESQWSVTLPDSTRIRVVEEVTYPILQGRLTLRFDSLLPCRRLIADTVSSP